MIGYVGGHAFEDNPLLGLGVGLGIALSITGLVELIRHRIARNRRREQEAGTPESAAGAEGSPDEKPQELV
jgi:hypothetical protein